MRSRTTRRFRKAFERLPHPVQRQARRAFDTFRADPQHPSLHFKRVHGTEPIYSVRVSTGYRALGVRQGGEHRDLHIGDPVEIIGLVVLGFVAETVIPQLVEP